MKVRRVCAYPPEYVKLKLLNVAKNKDMSLNALIIEALIQYINPSTQKL